MYEHTFYPAGNLANINLGGCYLGLLGHFLRKSTNITTISVQVGNG